MAARSDIAILVAVRANLPGMSQDMIEFSFKVKVASLLGGGEPLPEEEDLHLIFQSRFLKPLIGRDSGCLLTNAPFDECVAAHIVPQSRPDVSMPVLFPAPYTESQGLPRYPEPCKPADVWSCRWPSHDRRSA